MLKDIVAVRYLGEHRLHLRFENGISGEVDLARMIEFKGVFAELLDEAEFAKVRVDPSSGTITWPNGADLDPDVLYAAVTRQPVSVDEVSEDGSAV